MESTAGRAIAIVGVGAVLPEAPDAAAFWRNVKDGRYSISDVPKDRWDSDLYYDPNPKAPDKSYTKIGGWVRDFEWEPLKWRLPIPPKVGDAMDLTQKWAILVVRQALADYGYPDQQLDPERTAVIFGNAMGGDTHLYSSARILFPEYAEELDRAPSFGALPAEVRAAVLEELQQGIGRRLPPITEDTMPGELSNIVAGRIAALYDFRGPNFTTDAACASAVAAIKSAIEGLIQRDYDAVLTGGIDANMSPASFVKFCKIGALSATGSRPYAEGADGFVMGEGAVAFLMKRLADAERDGDRIYAVLRGIGASSDGRGKGITAPNPAGQKLAVRRAWQNAGLSPQPGDLVEGHGTSTAVGDVVEVQSMIEVFQDLGLPPGSVSLGSVKSNIGHLKGAAGAVGILKATLALHEKVLPPSINYERPNPGVDWASSPFVVNTTLRPWDDVNADGVRRVGASAFGFGGTNFHTVLEEYVPGRLETNGGAQVQGAEIAGGGEGEGGGGASDVRAPLRGALVIGGDSDDVVRAKLERVLEEARAGRAPEPAPPQEADLRAPVRLAIDYGDAEELAGKAEKALAALEQDQSNRWRALRSKGVFLGRGPATKVAFLFSGQGSQYVNMLRELRDAEPVVAETFAEADAVMEPLLGRPLTNHIYVDGGDEAAVAAAEEALKQTAITQPAVLATETALARLLGAYGIVPDMTMGHSLGEYGALVAAGSLSFPDALKAVSARGKEMTRIAFEDNGTMAAVFGPLDQVQGILDGVDGYVVIANINSTKECVIGGATPAVEKATAALQDAGYRVTALPVSHAFHTEIVAPASGALAEVLERLGIEPPTVPTIANISGDFYPAGPGATGHMVDILSRQVGSPVQFVKGLRRLYDAGARVFVELGPKRALTGFVTDVLGDHDGVVPLFTNHPRLDDATGVNIALCGLYAAGLGTGVAEVQTADAAPAAASAPTAAPVDAATPVVAAGPADAGTPASAPAPAWPAAPAAGPYEELGRLFAEFLDRGMAIYRGGASEPEPAGTRPNAVEPVRIGVTGAALGLPGTERVFDERNLSRILDGEQFIVPVPHEQRRAMANHHIVRLVKGNGGQANFETIDDPADVVKLAGRGGELDLVEEYGFPEDRLQALDRVTRLAIAAGLEALRDAGIPLVQRYRTTTTGSQLPNGWVLPEEMRDDTGIIFASAFPGLDSLVDIVEGYYQDAHRRQELAHLRELRALRAQDGDESDVAKELDGRVAELEQEIEANPYVFDRRFLFRVLNMGHSQFAEYIGARGPNVGTNGACASGTQAVAMAQDWIETGRCRRVIVISADDITTDRLMPWFGSAFLASGAAAADERVEDAAIPFDKRRHGLIVGMGGAALVVESLDSSRARGLQPITEVLGTVMANSAYHGSRLNVEHIIDVMEQLVSGVEARWGLDRRTIAEQTVFVSHETYTPARGGSASAEILALRRVFGDAFDRIVIANTKGYTGHPMAVAMEDALAVKMLETGLVPPVANFREVDPELGQLNLSKGGVQPKQYSLRLGAGFGSQIAMDLMRWVPAPDGARRALDALGHDYRVVDPSAWTAFLRRATGSTEPQIEVVRRTLRVRSGGEVMQAGARAGAARPILGDVGTPEAGRPPVGTAPAPAMAPGSTGQAAAAPAPAPASAAAAASADAVAARVLAIVAEKTGYPPDMLDLEADLGIDTVKQAEMFAAVREEWDIERDDTVALRDYPTLARVIEFVREKRPDLRQAGAGAGATRPVVGDVGTPEAGRPPVGTAPAPADAARSAPAAPAAAPASATGAAPAGPVAGDPVAATILAIVAEKTGYPEDMLELELDLEADLGIDTVKQAEMFAAVREEWGIERDDTVALRDYPTLARVIEFVYEKRPDLRQAGAGAGAAGPGSGGVAAAAKAASAPASATGAAAASSVAAGDSWAGRVPVPVLRPPLDLTRANGVDLADGDRVIVFPDRGGVGRALISRLEKRGVEALVVEGAPRAEDLASQLDAWTADGAIRGVYWLPAVDAEDLSALDAESWREALRIRVKLLYTTMRALYDTVGGAGTFLVSGTRLGGMHGYDVAGAVDPLGGAVTGFTKAFKREKPDALVKAVDFAPSRKTAALADMLIEETLRDPGVVEVGHRDGRRWTIGLRERPADGTTTHGTPLDLGPDSVFVVTGAAGSITSAIIADLAGASHATFHLLDLTPEPDRDDADLRRVVSDRDGLKRDIFERLKASGERATPALVEKELARLERSAAALSAIEAVEEAGGTAHYHVVNLLDVEAVDAAVRQIRETSGRVDALVHAAGIEISRLLPDKEPGEFDLVFDVKADGLFHLLSAFDDVPLGAVVVFSSIAGRFGNAGQADYSAANDLMCKIVSSFRATRPDTLGIAIDWTAWADIGMAARGSIPAIMKQAGIDMLTPAVGIPVVRRELTGGTKGEVVIAGSLGVMVQEFDEAGGLDRDAAQSLAAARGPMIGTVRSMGVHSGLVVETELDPAAQPFLHDHQIADTPVLPGVMGIEAMAEAAGLLFPDMRVAAIEHVEFHAPFKFYRSEPRTVTVQASFRQDDDDIVADCRLLGSRLLHGRSEPEVTTHFTAQVRLRAAAESAGHEAHAVKVPAQPSSRADTVSAADIYHLYFHGPAYQVLAQAWQDDDVIVGRLAEGLPPNHVPPEQPTFAVPRLVELCFQTAGLRELAADARMGLPYRIERLELLNGADDEDDALVALARAAEDGAFDVDLADQAGNLRLSLRGYRTMALPDTPDEHALSSLRTLVGR